MDRRSEKTKEAIEQSFYQLLSEKKYPEITIQDILDRANVGRSTFYSHFHTKDELVTTICLNCLSALMPMALWNLLRRSQAFCTTSGRTEKLYGVFSSAAAENSLKMYLKSISIRKLRAPFFPPILKRKPEFRKIFSSIIYPAVLSNW